MDSIQVTIPGLKVHDVWRFEGREEISRPFQFYLWVRIELKEKVPNGLTQKPVGITLKDKKGGDIRFFHGIISSVTEPNSAPLKEGYRLVKIGVSSTFGLLQDTLDSQIFFQKTTLEIIEEVLRAHKVDCENQVKSAGKKKRVFCVQYQESHFSFLSRLMEEEGIFYFFEFKAGKHTLIFMDEIESCPSLGGKIRFWTNEVADKLYADSVCVFQKEQHLKPQKFSTNDYFFKKPEQKLLVKEGEEGTIPLSLYAYPGYFEERGPGAEIAKKRLASYECRKTLFAGQSTASKFSAGVTFTLTEHGRLDGAYVLMGVSHFYGLDDAAKDIWENTFEAIPKKTTFRPLFVTPRPVAVQETATVVGPSGDEIYTDEYGRIKVKFHWDTRDVKADERSDWIRVAYGWAGHGWGVVQTPRIGQEVVVTFLNHDPDRPLVVGCVYNGTHKPPYVTEDPTKSTVKSHSTKKGTAENYNEFRFTDKKGEEEVYLQAEKKLQMLVKNAVIALVKEGGIKVTLDKGDTTFESKDGNYSFTLDKGNSKTTLKQGNMEILLDKGNRTTKIKGNDETTITSGKGSLAITGGGYTVKISGGDVSIETTGQFKVTAAKGVSFSTPQDFAVKCRSFSITAMQGFDCKATSTINFQGSTISAKGMNMNLQGMQTNIKGMNIQIQGAMTSIKGAMVMVN